MGLFTAVKHCTQCNNWRRPGVFFDMTGQFYYVQCYKCKQMVSSYVSRADAIDEWNNLNTLPEPEPEPGSVDSDGKPYKRRATDGEESIY